MPPASILCRSVPSLVTVMVTVAALGLVPSLEAAGVPRPDAGPRLAASSALLAPQQQGESAAKGGQVRGAVTTQAGTSFLPGVTVTLTNAAGGGMPIVGVSDGSGQFAFDGLPPGDYDITVALDGFEPAKRRIHVDAGRALELVFDLSLAKLSTTVNVVEQAPPATATASTQTISGNMLTQGPVRGDTYQALLPMLPSVVRGTDGRIRVAGGDPTQSGLQVSSASVTDPSTGDFAFDLPGDAVESVQVLENPYSAEFGRFSSGVTQIQTRKGGDSWQLVPNSFIPRLQTSQGMIRGIGSFTPRLSIGGPVIAGKVFVSQSLQYRLVKSEVRSLPGDPHSEVRSFDSFTRLDANLTPHHTLTTAFAVYPRTIDGLNLATFTPLNATPSFHQAGYNVGASERAILSPKALLETTFNVKQYNVNIYGQGLEAMELTPWGTGGNYFNQQARNTRTVQGVSVLTVTPNEAHVIKAGVDVMVASYDGTSASLPVNILRADRTLAERISFAGPTVQQASGSDLSLFLQDEWHATGRLEIEGGARLDRDGVLGRVNVSPRSGATLSLTKDGGAVLRGGVGLFYQRTPLNVAAFDTMEPRTISYFAGDGATRVGAPLTFRNVSRELATPYAVVGNVEYDQRVTSKVLLKVNVLRRHGSNEFIVNPLVSPSPALVLSNAGRSDHWEGEVTARLSATRRTELFVSYVRSRSVADLNTFDSYFGNIRNPVIVSNQSSITTTDVPHRFLMRGTIGLPKKLEIAPVLEVRSGFPYSLVNENQEIVGTRNEGGRFPTLATLDVSVQRPVKIRGVKTRIGFRVYNALNTFNPRDVMNNVNSPFVGYFYNPIPRTIGLNFWIDR